MTPAFNPAKLDFRVPTGAIGPDITSDVDPSNPGSVSFHGGVRFGDASADTVVSAMIDLGGDHFALRDLIVLDWVWEAVDPSELPPGHHGHPPRRRVLEASAFHDGPGAIALTTGQVLLVRVEYIAGADPGLASGNLSITGQGWDPINIPLTLTTFEAPQVLIVETRLLQDNLTVVAGGQAQLPVEVKWVSGPAGDVAFEKSPVFLDAQVAIPPVSAHIEPQSIVTVPLFVQAAADAKTGTFDLAIRQFVSRPPFNLGLIITILAPPPPPVPDPRVDHFDAVYVDGSTKRICQLTGGGDPEGKPHPNDTTRFALLGTDLGSSFDHLVNGQHRTYFFFGDSHAGHGGGDDDGDAIAFTTDDQPEPEGVHLQFIMGDRQWRRLVIPGISLGTFEVPTGGFSHMERIFVFATTGHIKLGDADFMENSVLASVVDAHDNFEFHYLVSSRDDRVDTPSTGGKFINISPSKISNNQWPGLPDNAVQVGEGLLLAGSGSYRRSAPFLAYVPLRAGEIPRKEDWRFFSGFGAWQPGFGPSGPPTWDADESKAIPLFDDQVGELSFCWNVGLGRWLLVYGGCAPDGCGIVVRSSPTPWGPWTTTPQLLFCSEREKPDPRGKYMFECGPYGAYIISRYDRWEPAQQHATIYYTMSNGACPQGEDKHIDNTEPRYQVHLMKSTIQLVMR